MRRRLLGLGLCLAVVTIPHGLSRAEELGVRRNLAISAERMFGLYIDNVTVETVAGRHDTTHNTVLGFGWQNTGSALGTPRLGIDFFVTDGFTVGGNFGVYSFTSDGRSNVGFLLGARAGYALRLGHSVSFWPRGGLTYALLSVEDPVADSYILSLTLDAPFAFALTEGFAVLLGPTLEVGFVGERVGRNSSELLFGLMAGLAGWFGL